MEVSLQARIDEIPWYHEFDFGNGLTARSKALDVDWHRKNWRFIEESLAEIDFRDKTVLDVGCWDGYWSFYAERRGAKRVLAADDFTQNWSREEGLLLAKDLLGSRIETKSRLSVYDLASLGRKFDVILLLGVYYHLLDPFYAFAQLRHCCHVGTVVCIEGNEGLGLPPNAALFDTDERTSKFLPTRGHLFQLLRAAYLSITTERFLLPQPARLGWRWRLRMCWQALLGSRSGLADLVELARQTRTVGRVFLTCAAFEGENAAHLYRPPFGLDAFDPRFKGENNHGAGASSATAAAAERRS